MNKSSKPIKVGRDDDHLRRNLNQGRMITIQQSEHDNNSNGRGPNTPEHRSPQFGYEDQGAAPGSK